MELAPRSDEELVESARAGSAHALRTLLERHETTLVRYLERRMPPGIRRKVAPEDLLQEVYLVAAQRLAAFEDRGDGAFRAWLLGIAEMKVREAARAFLGTAKRGAVQEVSRGGRPDTAAFVSSTPSPSQVAEGHELRDAAAHAMSELPEDYRRILRLVQVDGLTLRDAAERMGRSHDAAKKLYGRALARFAELLGPTKR